MFLDMVDDLGQPIPSSTKKELTILTAYNDSSIMQHGSVCIQCAHKSKWTTLKFFVVTTEGPTIIGLPSLRNLELISLHCTIKEDKGPINFIVELTNSYPNQFDRIGHFKSDYHIVLKPDHHPMIHALRKCPIHLRDEIKELKTMESQGLIRKVSEPTEWVCSIVYIYFRKRRNGKLRLCLDPKDLNRAIMRCHYKIPTMLLGAQHFSKLDTKNRYWSIPLDKESQLLTTFHSPFGRFCFRRMPFGLMMSEDVFMQGMDMILEKCLGTIGLIDDVIVYGKMKEEHDSNLHNIMRIAQTMDKKQIHFLVLSTIRVV